MSCFGGTYFAVFPSDFNRLYLLFGFFLWQDLINFFIFVNVDLNGCFALGLLEKIQSHRKL